jgi:hypothetical protein
MIAPRCPCCEEPMGPGHTPMTIEYTCPDCGEEFCDEWCSAVDGECPACGCENISADDWDIWDKWDEPAP